MMTATGRRTNSAAVISLVSALLAPVGHCIGVAGITLIVISLVTGHMALAEINRTGEDGSGYAVAGLIISYAHLVITALVVLFFFNLVVALFGFWLHLLFTH